jgi:hypothetical protein
VLFSSDDVATFINGTFEPVWESVRPVPIVTIDFGNGQTITRTLHGNIATYLCGPDGRVFDILPGIYEPKEYLNQLTQFTLLYRHAHQQFVPVGEVRDLEQLRQRLAAHLTARLQAYHDRQAERLRADQPADVLVRAQGGLGKLMIEQPVQLIAAGDVAKFKANDWPVPPAPAPPAVPVAAVPTRPEEIAGWKELAEDTRINESVRRRMIHEKLAAAGRVESKDVTKWLYKEVLHADLDDPTLGIGELLNKRYPFAAEDEAARRK